MINIRKEINVVKKNQEKDSKVKWSQELIFQNNRDSSGG